MELKFKNPICPKCKKEMEYVETLTLNEKEFKMFSCFDCHTFDRLTLH